MSSSPDEATEEHQPRERRVQISRRWRTVRIAFEAGSICATGTIKNISPHGMFIRTERLPRVADGITAVFRVPDRPTITVFGRVRWTTAQLDPELGAKPGFGFQIDEPGGDYLEFLEHVLTATGPLTQK